MMSDMTLYMIIVAVDDFRKCTELSRQIGKWPAWYENYFPKYEDVFRHILQYLYRCNALDLKDAVENYDFDQALDIANTFIQDDGLTLVENILLRCTKKFAFDREYDVYLLIGLGHVDGTSLPAGHPFLYFGIERYESLERLNYLVSHEYNHCNRSDPKGFYVQYDGILRSKTLRVSVAP